jgi:hypothetical protein
MFSYFTGILNGKFIGEFIITLLKLTLIRIDLLEVISTRTFDGNNWPSTSI